MPAIKDYFSKQLDYKILKARNSNISREDVNIDELSSYSINSLKVFYDYSERDDLGKGILLDMRVGKRDKEYGQDFNYFSTTLAIFPEKKPSKKGVLSSLKGFFISSENMERKNFEYSVLEVNVKKCTFKPFEYIDSIILRQDYNPSNYEPL